MRTAAAKGRRRHATAEQACDEKDTDEETIQSTSIDDDVAALLSGHDWPGNVRELRNALERALLVAEGAALKPWHFALVPAEPTAIATSGTALDLATVERRHVETVLALCNGNRSRAARLLGITRATLRRKLA